MCNLYSNTTAHQAMRQLYMVKPERSDLGNLPALTALYPKSTAPIVAIGKAGDRSLVRSHWGFLTASKSKRTGAWNKPQAWNNTRDDKITTSGLWKGSFEKRRCLVPATGYAEATGKKPATWQWLRVQDTEGFAFAGIWRYQKGTLGDTDVDTLVHSVVTCGANELTARVHNRMPVILAEADYEAW